MKKMTVVFRNNDARLFVNSKPKTVMLMDKVIEHPDLSRVVGVSPHYWKLVGDKIFPMNAEEMKLKDQKHHSIVRHFRTNHLYSSILSVLICTVIFVLGGLTMYYFIKQGRIK